MEDIIMLQETKATQQNNKEMDKESYVRKIDEMLSLMDSNTIKRIYNFVYRVWIHS